MSTNYHHRCFDCGGVTCDAECKASSHRDESHDDDWYCAACMPTAATVGSIVTLYCALYTEDSEYARVRVDSLDNDTARASIGAVEGEGHTAKDASAALLAALKAWAGRVADALARIERT